MTPEGTPPSGAAPWTEEEAIAALAVRAVTHDLAADPGPPWPAPGGAAAFLAELYFVFEQTAGFPLTEATIRWGALRIVPCFALGCALYLVYRKAPLKAPWTCSAISFGLMVLSAALGLWDGITVLLAGALILSLASLPNQRAGWLASRPAVYLGEISYSVYMVCVPWKLLAVGLAYRIGPVVDRSDDDED